MKKVLLIALLATTVQMQAQAVISVDQTTSPAVMRNNGYSKDLTNTVNISKARATGTEYYTDDEQAFQKQNKFVRFWRKLYVYTDPAAEDYSFFHHDTDPVPKYTDL